MSRVKTSQRITLAMAESLRHQGYAATGMQHLAEAAAAPIGSLYHHFKGGKREIAEQALTESGAAYLELVLAKLAEHDDPVEAVQAAFADAAEVMETTGWANLCPVATVLGEVADVEPELRAVGDRIFTTWLDAGTAYAEQHGLSTEDARAFSRALISGLEGALILARTQRSREPILATGQMLALSLRTLLATTSRPA